MHPSPLLKQSRRDGPSTSPKVWIGVAAGGPAQSRRDPAQSRRDPAQSRRQSAAQKTAKPTQNLRKPQSTLPFLPNTRQTPGRHSSRPKVALPLPLPVLSLSSLNSCPSHVSLYFSLPPSFTFWLSASVCSGSCFRTPKSFWSLATAVIVLWLA